MPISVAQAQELATAQGSFIVLDFYATWCGPCTKMDIDTWSQPEVQAAQQSFVNVRVDATTNTATILQQYHLKGIPALIILDAEGNEYFRRVGLMTSQEVRSVLADFPADMRGPYAADFVAREQPDAFNSHFLRGRHYQQAARGASGSVRGKLATTSTDALEDASAILSQKSNIPASLQERIDLMVIENLLLRGRSKKVLKELASLDAELDAKNEALACYIRGLAYHRTKRPKLADECYSALQEAVDNAEYLALYEATVRE